MTTEEQIEALKKELNEISSSLTEMRQRIKHDIEQHEVPFHQDVLIKMQHMAWDIEREIIRLTPKEV